MHQSLVFCQDFSSLSATKLKSVASQLKSTAGSAMAKAIMKSDKVKQMISSKAAVDAVGKIFDNIYVKKFSKMITHNKFAKVYLGNYIPKKTLCLLTVHVISVYFTDLCEMST